MKTYILEKKQIIKKPIEVLFAFFERPENLEKLTPGDLGFQILTPSPIEMKQGALIDYVIRIMGIPVRWRTLITTYQPPHLFVDEQIQGPYSYWHHVHSFRSVPEGTEMVDRVTYVLPLGWLGRFIHWLFVKRQLKNIFAYRAEVITQHLQTQN